MAIETVQQDGAVGKNIVEILLVGKGTGAEDVVCPALPQDPRFVGMSVSIFFYRGLNFGNSVGVAEVRLGEGFRTLEQMQVRIGEAGKN